jgi:hypothetical protein
MAGDVLVGMCVGQIGRDRSIRRSGHANTSCGAISNVCQDERGGGKTRGANSKEFGSIV